MEKAFFDFIKRQAESEYLASQFSKQSLISDSLLKTLNSSSIADFLGKEQSRVAASSLVSFAEKDRQSITNLLKISNPLPGSNIR